MSEEVIKLRMGTVEFRDKYLRDQVGKAGFKNLNNALASIRKDEQSSIIKSQQASEPGTPPHTRRGLMSRAIAYAVADDKKSGVAGPRYSIVGDAAKADEFGGNFRGEEYPKRPFAEPALEHAIPRFAGSWAGSLGE